MATRTRTERSLWIWLVALAASGCASSLTTNNLSRREREAWLVPDQNEYRLQSGDLLDVKLYFHPELNQEVMIRPDGRISLQLVDDVVARGRTVPELRTELVHLFSRHLREPVVAVILTDSSTSRVFVGGEVTKPGEIALRGNLTCLQAIFHAGGFLNTANEGTIVLLRDQGTVDPLVLVVDLGNDLRTTGERNDVLLRSGDIVFVPKTSIAELNDFVEQYIEKLVPFQQSTAVTYSFGRFTRI